MMAFCTECGSGNPEGSEFCTRCGAVIPQEPLRAGKLVLPDWLAASAVHSPSPQPSTPLETLEPEEPSSAPPAIPTGTLDETIPAWLKRPLQQSTNDQEPSLLTDPTDTRGFISEDDLPAWIRQIGLADAARKADAARDHHEPAPIERSLDVATPPVPARRRLLPGDLDAVRSPANPWLDRTDRPASETSSDQAGAIDVAPALTPIDASPANTPALTPTSPVQPSRLGQISLRHALIAAICLLVVVLIFLIKL